MPCSRILYFNYVIRYRLDYIARFLFAINFFFLFLRHTKCSFCVVSTPLAYCCYYYSQFARYIHYLLCCIPCTLLLYYRSSTNPIYYNIIFFLLQVYCVLNLLFFFFTKYWIKQSNYTLNYTSVQCNYFRICILKFRLFILII